jgi:hypothetical protein
MSLLPQAQPRKSVRGSTVNHPKVRKHLLLQQVTALRIDGCVAHSSGTPNFFTSR